MQYFTKEETSRKRAASWLYNDHNASTQQEKEAGIEKLVDAKVTSRIVALRDEIQQRVDQSSVHEKIRANGVNSRIDALLDEMQQMVDQSVRERIRASGVNSRIEALRDELQQMIDQSVRERLRASGINSRIESLRDEMQLMVEQSVREMIKAESGSKVEEEEEEGTCKLHSSKRRKTGKTMK